MIKPTSLLNIFWARKTISCAISTTFQTHESCSQATVCPWRLEYVCSSPPNFDGKSKCNIFFMIHKSTIIFKSFEYVYL